jgi:hypothetical protein
MYTKKILSAAAAVAVMSTGAMAFDTNSTGGLLKYNEDANTITIGTYTSRVNGVMTALDLNRTVTATGTGQARLTRGAIGTYGDALIYPAFYSSNGWESTFTVVNTSSNHAVVAKVVLYGRENSKELKDFNIYLSANDVFRATIKDGVITSTDDSTVVEGTDRTTNPPTGRVDTVTMASEDAPFSTSLDEPAGYIAVFAMLESNGTTLARATINKGTVTTDKALSDAGKSISLGYHKQHLALWRDYRRLLDQCRSDNWRSGINGGIYTDDQERVVSPGVDMGLSYCSYISSTQDVNENGIADGNMSFTPPSNILTGSILVGGDDSRGTRNMLLPATPLRNFSGGDGHIGSADDNHTVLWTEGEFASIADRCIDSNATLQPNRPEYNSTCIDFDSNIFELNTSLYEYSDAENSQIIITQPYKRVVVQLGTTATVETWKTITRNTPIAGLHAGMATNYGGFKLTAVVYNDDEDRFDPATGGFTVSPATTPTTLIPNELSAFNPIPDTSGYTDGFARLTFTSIAGDSLDGIATQMSASKMGDTVETNWIYSIFNQ